ncbi:glutathione S-transferase family protein [Prosthecomicrobium sp. N25]|uniref:glutathione S-transferase family protein n=1 Tax=Prosthecomicrobium sp. N25 TaxID=3129254 RepID=UPI003078800D
MHTLYYSPAACSLAPHIVLEEIGKPYGLEWVQAGVKTVTPEWKAMNPKGRVPALSGVPGRIGGGTDLLTEANAIMIYLGRTNPEAGLIPADPAREARMIEWMNWLTSSFHAAAYASVRRPARFVDDPALFPALQAKGMKTVLEQCAYIDGLLGDGRDWAVDGGYTLADPYLFTFWVFLYRLDGFDLGPFPAWTAHARKVLARPATRRALEQEKIEVSV